MNQQEFNLYSDGGGGGTVPARMVIGPSHLLMHSKKRPSSANSASSKNRSQKAASKAIAVEEGQAISLMPREALLLELTEAKKKIRLMEAGSAQLRAEVQRLDVEVNKQQQRIDRLLDPMAAGKSGQSATEARRELEKGLLVRQLKQQMAQLRQTIVDKESELEAHRRSAKASSLTELTAEREEYYLEAQRLKHMVRDLREELHSEKRRRERGERGANAGVNAATGMGGGGSASGGGVPSHGGDGCARGGADSAGPREHCNRRPRPAQAPPATLGAACVRAVCWRLG